MFGSYSKTAVTQKDPFHRTVLWFNSSLSVLTQPFRLGLLGAAMVRSLYHGYKHGEFTPMFVGIRAPYTSQDKISQSPYNYGYISVYIYI